MIGGVGSDGKEMVMDLALQGVYTEGISIVENEPTGTAMILLEEKTGENRSMCLQQQNSIIFKILSYFTTLIL